MEEAITIESLAAQIAEADQQEQPAADSSPAEQISAEEGSQDETQAEQAEGQGEEPQNEESPAEKLVEWTTASGEAYSVTESELKNGYLRQQQFTKQSQSLAEERKSAHAKVQEQAQLVAALAADIGEVQALNAQLQQFQQVDWNRLQAEDPVQANTLMTRHLLLRQSAQEAQAKLQSKAQKLDADRGAQFAQESAEAYEHLKRVIPGFNDKVLEELRDGSIKAGHRAEDLARVSDKSMLLDLWKARQWDALQAKKPEALNKAKNLPPPSRSPARATQQPSKAQEVSRAINLKRSFRPDEFAQLLKATR